jgi:hypothetical protein
MIKLLRSIVYTFVLFAFLSFAGTAKADTPNANSVSPVLSFCLGQSNTCVMPDFGLSTVSYDLDAKKWAGGVQSIGVGYMLLFASDQPWASGIAVHGSFNFSQTEPSFFAPTVTAVLLRYFEVGATFRFMDGAIGKYLTLGANVPFDTLTGKTIPLRMAEARAKAENQ